MKSFFLLILLPFALTTFGQRIQLVQQGRAVSIRGLSVVNDHIAWLSGSKGAVAVTKDGGTTWRWLTVKEFPGADFRDIQAFSANEALIMSSGTPALILKTKDGGRTWKVLYQNSNPQYFFDAMKFDTRRHGIVLGDPINGEFLLLETKDEGETWRPFRSAPVALPGEAAFAASGTCLRTDHKNIFIVTGGSHSRLLQFRKEWAYMNLPLTHGLPSQGAFSIVTSHIFALVVGGDYAQPLRRDSVAAIGTGVPYGFIGIGEQGPRGYQSCVAKIRRDYLATGTAGSSFSEDGGKSWGTIDTTSFNVCGSSRDGKLCLLAGDHGRVAVFRE